MPRVEYDRAGGPGPGGRMGGPAAHPVGCIFHAAVDRDVASQFGPQPVVGHVPGGLPEIAKNDEVDHTSTCQVSNVDSDAPQITQIARHAKPERNRLADLTAASLGQRPNV